MTGCGNARSSDVRDKPPQGGRIYTVIFFEHLRACCRTGLGEDRLVLQ
jgi:hypothetical protein